MVASASAIAAIPSGVVLATAFAVTDPLFGNKLRTALEESNGVKPDTLITLYKEHGFGMKRVKQGDLELLVFQHPQVSDPKNGHYYQLENRKWRSLGNEEIGKFLSQAAESVTVVKQEDAPKITPRQVYDAVREQTPIVRKVNTGPIKIDGCNYVQYVDSFSNGRRTSVQLLQSYDAKPRICGGYGRVSLIPHDGNVAIASHLNLPLITTPYNRGEGEAGLIIHLGRGAVGYVGGSVGDKYNVDGLAALSGAVAVGIIDDRTPLSDILKRRSFGGLDRSRYFVRVGMGGITDKTGQTGYFGEFGFGSATTLLRYREGPVTLRLEAESRVTRYAGGGTIPGNDGHYNGRVDVFNRSSTGIFLTVEGTGRPILNHFYQVKPLTSIHYEWMGINLAEGLANLFLSSTSNANLISNIYSVRTQANPEIPDKVSNAQNLLRENGAGIIAGATRDSLNVVETGQLIALHPQSGLALWALKSGIDFTLNAALAGALRPNGLPNTEGDITGQGALKIGLCGAAARTALGPISAGFAKIKSDKAFYAVTGITTGIGIFGAGWSTGIVGGNWNVGSVAGNGVFNTQFPAGKLDAGFEALQEKSQCLATASAEMAGAAVVSMVWRGRGESAQQEKEFQQSARPSFSNTFMKNFLLKLGGGSGGFEGALGFRVGLDDLTSWLVTGRDPFTSASAASPGSSERKAETEGTIDPAHFERLKEGEAILIETNRLWEVWEGTDRAQKLMTEQKLGQLNDEFKEIIVLWKEMYPNQPIQLFTNDQFKSIYEKKNKARTE